MTTVDTRWPAAPGAAVDERACPANGQRRWPGPCPATSRWPTSSGPGSPGPTPPHPVRLPTELQLCEIHHVSRITISKALDLLEQEGLIERAPGRGTRTVPQAIRQWTRLRQNRVIFVFAGGENLEAIPNSYYGQIYQGVFSCSERAGYRLAIRHIPSYRTEAVRNPYLPDPDSCLGIIFVGMMNEPTVQFYSHAGYHVVCVDYWTTSPLADAVVVDCYSEGQAAIRFLLDQQHRELFYVGNMLTFRPPPEKESDAVLFLAGMQRALDLQGLPAIPAERIYYIDGRPSGAETVAQWLASLRPRPTAGVVFGSGICQRLLGCLEYLGVRCPEDVSLMTKLWVGEPSTITSLRSDPRWLGELAVDTLLTRLRQGRTSGLRLVVPSRLDPGSTVSIPMPCKD